MRRRTHEIFKDHSENIIKSTQKYSRQSKTKMVSARQLYHSSKDSLNFSYSEAVTKLILQELLQSLEAKFRIVEENKYLVEMMHFVEKIEVQLVSILDPISEDNKMKLKLLKTQDQPQTAVIQSYCGGKTIQYDYKSKNFKKPSISQIGSKDEPKQNVPSKVELISSLSSKCLIRLSKQQKLQIKQQLEALKLQSLQEDDKYDQLIRQKMLKQNVLKLATSLFKPNSQHSDKKNKFNKNLTAIDQFSYDYDSSSIPIKKFTRALPQKIKILNPICKINHKEVDQKRKVKKSKNSFSQIYETQTGQSKKQSKQNAQINQLNLIRKRSTKQFINLLSADQNKQQLDVQMKIKFQELFKTKAIRIRQLKQ